MTTNNVLNLEETIEHKKDESNDKHFEKLQSSWDKVLKKFYNLNSNFYY